MYAVYVIIYVLEIEKRFLRMFENWFFECDEDMQTTGLHATGCVMIDILQISQLFFGYKILGKIHYTMIR